MMRQGHPWLFDQAIQHQSHDGGPGNLAVIFNHKRRFLAVGLYDPHSPIRVRVLQHNEPATIDCDWFKSKLTAAAQLRAPLQNGATTGYRLVHGENDGLPGLVIDRYAGTLVIKLYTAAWIPHLRDVCAALADVAPAERWVLRLSRTTQKQSQYLFGLGNGMLLFGPNLNGPILFQENGLTFESDPLHGQKTGFFLDQRDNRARVEKLAGGKSVLNIFAYTGGFSVYAARGGARHVVSVDMSAPALEAAARNFARNQQIPNVAAVSHQMIAKDAFNGLAQMGQHQRRFDMVIIDPPMFAQNQSQVAQALSAYKKLTCLGLDVLNPGGILVQASCSSRIDAKLFFSTVHRAARQAGRPLHEFERTGHPPDHPITFKEGTYLKCLFAVAP
jgi:23S rRNA (cytosine1962-C5)-methyltransferase